MKPPMKHCLSGGLAKVWIRLCVVATFSSGIFFTADAMARAGGGRSVGRPPSRSAPRSAPPSTHPNPNPNSNSYGSPNGAPYGRQPAANPPAGSGGGFMRGILGGMAGGFLGSMIFGSLLGHTSGFGTGGGGGFGFFEMILLAGLGFVGYRLWQGRQRQPVPIRAAPPRQQQQQANRATRMFRGSAFGAEGDPEPTVSHYGGFRALAATDIDSEIATDMFFRLQAAWTRRDLAPVRDLLGVEVRASLEGDVEGLRLARKVNRLENISVRQSIVERSWSEDGINYSTVRFHANLLDYTVDEASGQVVHGSASVPIKFEEEWTFADTAPDNGWQLVGIHQI